jgi:hypothetical protein
MDERVSCDDDANKLVNCISILAAALLGFGADLLWAVECVHHADDDEKGGLRARCGDQILSLLSSTYTSSRLIFKYIYCQHLHAARATQREFFCAGACAAICEVKRLYLIISVNRCSGALRARR